MLALNFNKQPIYLLFVWWDIQKGIYKGVNFWGFQCLEHLGVKWLVWGTLNMKMNRMMDCHLRIWVEESNKQKRKIKGNTAWQISIVSTLKISNIGQSEAAQENESSTTQLVLTLKIYLPSSHSEFWILPWKGGINNTNSHLLSTFYASHYSKCFICIDLLDSKTTQ